MQQVLTSPANSNLEATETVKEDSSSRSPSVLVDVHHGAENQGCNSIDHVGFRTGVKDKFWDNFRVKFNTMERQILICHKTLNINKCRLGTFQKKY